MTRFRHERFHSFVGDLVFEGAPELTEEEIAEQKRLRELEYPADGGSSAPKKKSR